MDSTEPKIIETLKEMEERRAVVIAQLEIINTALATLDSIKSKVEDKSSIHSIKFESLDSSDIKNALKYSGELNIKDLVQKMDKSLWSDAIASTGLLEVLASEYKRKVDERFFSESKPVPAFSACEAQDLVNSIFANTKNFKVCAIGKTWKDLSDKSYSRKKDFRKTYVKQATFAIPETMRFSAFQGVEAKFNNFRYKSDDLLIFADVEGALRLVSGLSALPIQLRVSAKIQNVLGSVNVSRAEFPLVVSNEFFEVSIFKNGNVVLKFTDKKALREFNLCGADASMLPEPEFFK